MKNGNMPKTIQKWIDKHPHLVEDYHMECDGFGGWTQGEYSIWLYLEEGYWNSMTETTMIHAATVKDFMEETKFIEKAGGY